MNAFRKSSGRAAVLAGLASVLLVAAWPAAAATFTVNSVADAPDADLADGICADSSGLCTLRAAIMQANALGGTNVIDLSQRDARRQRRALRPMRPIPRTPSSAGSNAPPG